jgi:hypothetical protein
VENWKGTTLSFILHYQEQIWLYDQLQPPNEQTSDHAKMIYLQNAVYVIEELRSVQTTGSQLALANGTVPIYKNYEALLKSAASTYDRAHAPAKCQPTRSAERTDIWDANVTESFHEAYEFRFDYQPTLRPDHQYQTVKVGSSWEGGGPIQLPYIPLDSTIADNYTRYQNSAGIETESVRNPPRPAKRSRIHSYSSLFGKDSKLSESSEDI